MLPGFGETSVRNKIPLDRGLSWKQIFSENLTKNWCLLYFIKLTLCFGWREDILNDTRNVASKIRYKFFICVRWRFSNFTVTKKWRWQFAFKMWRWEWTWTVCCGCNDWKKTWWTFFKKPEKNFQGPSYSSKSYQIQSRWKAYKSRSSIRTRYLSPGKTFWIGKGCWLSREKWKKIIDCMEKRAANCAK